MPDSEVAVAATVAYQTTLRRLRAGLSGALTPEWLALGSYDRDDVARWEVLIAAAVAAFAEEAAAAAVGYVATVAEVVPPPLPTPTVLADPEVPFLRHWRGLNDGKLWEQSVEDAAGAVEEFANDVVHSTARVASDGVSDDVVGWRRVLVGPSCEWCALVSTQRYRSAESADFGHAKCDCTVAPIVGDADPGRVINRPLLRELKARGVGDRVSRNRQASRSLQAADNAAARRDRALAELAAERDPVRRGRLEARARRWDREAEAFRARAAEQAAADLKPRLPGDTGYVNPEGVPVPRP